MNGDLRQWFPTQIVRGALLRPDGTAIGVVGGGAPSWELRAWASRSQTGNAYHRLLLAQDVAVDVYLYDEPLDVAGVISTLHDRQARASHPLLADLLGDLADDLTDRAQATSSGNKQVIWTITVAGGVTTAPVRGALDIGKLLGKHTAAPAPTANRVLSQAVTHARALADALRQLDGILAPHVLEAEEIARLLYQQADPIRASRAPLAGSFLERIRRVILPLND